MEADVVWFESTASRYRLLDAAADLVLARHSGRAGDEARARIVNEIDLLGSTSVTSDTISPVDQRAFLDQYRRLIGAAAP